MLLRLADPDNPAPPLLIKLMGTLARTMKGSYARRC
jgi:hypothetical protein